MTFKAHVATAGLAALMIAVGATSGRAASAGDDALARAVAGSYPGESYAQAIGAERPGAPTGRAPGGAGGARPGGPGVGGPGAGGRGPGGPGGYGRGAGYGYRRGPSGGAVAAGVLGGLAAGALVGGAIASQPGPGYYGYRDGYGYPPPVAYDPGPVEYGAALPVGNVYGRDPRWVNYCVSRYPNFDPASGTYLASDGYRYPCR